MQLTDEPDKRCYPLQDHLFCRSCHIQSLIKMGCHPSNEIEVAYYTKPKHFFFHPKSAFSFHTFQIFHLIFQVGRNSRAVRSVFKPITN